MFRFALGIFAAALVLLGAYSAKLSSAPSLPETSYNYDSIVLPASFSKIRVRQADNTPIDNPVTNAGATLGRVLFYDKLLSVDSTLACASCHIQSLGFSDPDSVSTGVGGAMGTRNAMSLANVRFYKAGRFLWDELAQSLEEQTLMPIELEHEMGSDLNEVVTRLQSTTHYPDLFTDAFGTDDITSERMGMAMAQFLRSILSYRTRYDYGRAQVATSETDFPNFTAEENAGKTLFFSTRGRCSACHETDVMFLTRAFNTGLDSVTVDPGRGGHSGLEEDMGFFKSSALRNIALTAPYMHDGRFATLEEVVDFYDSGIQPHENLPFALMDSTGAPIRMHLNEDEKASLIAFLNTLTDEPMLTDVRWSDPFLPFVIHAVPKSGDIPSSGGTVSADIILRNDNTGPARFFLTSSVTSPDGVTESLQERSLRLAAGRENTVEFNHIVPETDAPGVYEITVRVEEVNGSFTLSNSFLYKKREVDQLADQSTTASALADGSLPAVFEVLLAFPNPFNKDVNFRFNLPNATDVTIEVMDLRGRRIVTVLDEERQAGSHQVRWEPNGLSAGLYLVSVRTADGKLQSQQVTLVR